MLLYVKYIAKAKIGINIPKILTKKVFRNFPKSPFCFISKILYPENITAKNSPVVCLKSTAIPY